MCIVAALEVAAVGQEREAGKCQWPLSHESPLRGGKERACCAVCLVSSRTSVPPAAWLTRVGWHALSRERRIFSKVLCIHFQWNKEGRNLQFLTDLCFKSRTDGTAFCNCFLASFYSVHFTLCHLRKGFMNASSALGSEQFSLSWHTKISVPY